MTIAGRSGSGKSTLLAVAGLLRRPDRGEVTIAGRPTSGLSGRERTVVRRDHVAVVHQSAQLFPSLTAVEQLELVAHIRGRLDRAPGMGPRPPRRVGLPTAWARCPHLQASASESPSPGR